jgi:predicted nucleic acid-binding protein
MRHRENLGRPFSMLEGQIAAITLVQKATLATRKGRDFSDSELALIDPFTI